MQQTISGVEQEADLEDQDGQDLRRFRRVFEHAAIGMLILRSDGQIVESNAHVRAMLGRDTSHLQRLTIYDIVQTDDRTTTAIRGMFSGRAEQLDIELQYHDAAGISCWGRLAAWLDREEGGGGPYTIIAQLQDITARKQGNEQLRRAQEPYRTLAHQIPFSSYIFAAEDVGQLLYQSPQISSLLGYTPEEWLVRPDAWYDHVHPDDLQRVHSSDAHSNESGEACALEYRCIARDGRIIWVRDERQIVLDSNGQPAYWQGTLVDITRQKETEECMLIQQALLTAMVETSLDGIVVNSEDGTVLAANKQFMRLWNISSDDLVGSSSAALHEHCVAQVADRDDAQAGVDDLHHRPDATGRKELLLKDGRTLDRYSSPVTAEDGAYYGRVWYYRDSTDRSSIERELRARERQLADAQRLAGLGSWEWNINSGDMRWSDEGFRILGVDPGSARLTVDFYLSLVHPHDRDRLEAALSRAIDESSPFQLDLMINCQDGNERMVNVQGEVVRNSGAPTIMRGTMLDVTVRKELEAQLERQALLDPLTGLPNRRSLSSRIEEALERSRATRFEVALLFIDLDNFKTINDQLGHDAGDDVLIEVAARLGRCIRDRDMAVRLGGDEFVVLLDQVHDIESVIQIANRLLAEISMPIQTGRSASPCNLTASIGLVMSGATTRDAEELLHASDAAMYSAKAQGKARWTTASAQTTG